MKQAAVALLLLGLAVSLPAAVSTTAYVSKTSGIHDGLGTVTLVQALEDQTINRIELVDDYAAGDEFVQLQGAPFPVGRNVTLTSTPGSYYTLDLNFAQSVVEICAMCSFTLANLTLANARRGTSPQVDFFVGQPGSVLVLERVHRHRLACTREHDAAETLQELKRSTILPGANQPQQVLFQDVTYKGKVYPDSLVYKDITYDAPRIFDEGRGYTGGYAQHAKDSYRTCENYVSHECLRTESAESCVNKVIDEVRAQQGSHGRLSGPLLAVAIAVPVVVAMLLGSVLGMLLYHRKQKCGCKVAKQDCEAGCGMPADRMTGKSVAGGSIGGALLMPKSISSGWELQSSFASPFLGAVEDLDAPIEFGEFIGAGSFGRVYRARWGGRDVAVKVVEHNQDTAEAVIGEMHMLMAFNSPYVIKAYRCLTYKRILAPIVTDCNDGMTPDTRESLNTCYDSFEGPPLQASQLNAAAQAARNSRDRRGNGSSFDQSRSGGGSIDGSSSIAGVVSPRGSRTSNEAAGSRAAMNEASANRQSQGTPVRLVGPLVHARSSRSLHATPSAGRNSNSSSSVQVTSGGTNVQTVSSRSSGRGGGQGSGGSRNVPDGINMLATWVVQEYCDSGTLKAFAVRNDVPARVAAGDKQALLLLVLMLRDTAKGLAALHNQAVVHGDLNSRNVLVATDPMSDAGASAKIADLGISKAIAQHKTHRTTTNLGTITHSAPELLRSGRMSPHVDVYSFGIMMWELFTGQEAFGKLLYGQFFETIVVNDLRPVVPASMPQDYTTLMEHAWATDPAERPTAQQLVECLNRIAGSRIAALQAEAPAAAPASAFFATTATAAPVAHKTADELLNNPSKRQLQREQQQLLLLKAVSRKSAKGSKARRLSLTIEPGEDPGDVGDDDGFPSVPRMRLRRSPSEAGLRGLCNGSSRSCCSNIPGAGSKLGVIDHSRVLPGSSNKDAGLSPLSGAGAQAQWFV